MQRAVLSRALYAQNWEFGRSRHDENALQKRLVEAGDFSARAPSLPCKCDSKPALRPVFRKNKGTNEFSIIRNSISGELTKRLTLCQHIR